MSEITVRKIEVPYGRVFVIKILGLILLCLLTYFLCPGKIFKESHIDFHVDEIDNHVTISTEYGFVGTSSEFVDNGIKVISTSTIPVDAVVKTQTGRYLFTVYKLQPGDSFYFKPEESVIVSVAAS
jgi:hypothetical protein